MTQRSANVSRDTLETRISVALNLDGSGTVVGQTEKMGVTPNIELWMFVVAETVYRPWVTEIAAFRCPSDPGVGLPASGRTNFGANVG